VAVVVLCRNEERHIGRCLDSLLANDYDPRLVDLIVVDGMSTDRTREIVTGYARRCGRVRMVDNPKQTIPAGLNVGIRQADAEIVMRIDAHALYPPNYISGLVRALGQYGADNVGGLLEIDQGKTAWQRAVALIWSHPFAAGNAVHRTVPRDSPPRPAGTVFPGCFRRSVFERIGTFNELLVRAEDRELNARLAAAGGKILLDPSVSCTYFPRTAPGSYVRYCFINGSWVFYARRFTDVRLVSPRNLVPLLFVVWHLLAAAGVILWPAALPYLLAPIAAYWVLAAVCAAQAAWKCRSLRLVPCMFVLFPMTHYPYGLGSLWGWIRATIHDKRLLSWLDQALKRTLDVAMASLGLLLGLPLLALVAVAIKLDSPGPVFYRGVRIGRHFKPFRLFKFRTMVANAEQLGGSTASKHDPRVTRVGRFLRRTKLDELPNLINVLIGQMSLVGPRPEVKFYTDMYTEEERFILSVRPGITDLASIEFANQQALIGEEDPEGDFQARVLPRKNALRLKYARERSFWMDLRILGATFWLFVGQVGNLLHFSKPLATILGRYGRQKGSE
jgi:lipopolysaccharide/colanic/teichoic acid biosynthesis glycosyltransferase/GT2 family glycosyltransferase